MCSSKVWGLNKFIEWAFAKAIHLIPSFWSMWFFLKTEIINLIFINPQLPD
jgi:hypothetical protein